MTAKSNHYDFLIVGGGVIGLSLAWELAQYDARVCVVDRGPLGKEASWAGAGMIPPGADQASWVVATPLEQLESLSQQLHPEWHEKLLEQTGIDNEYRPCGSLHLACNEEEVEALQTNAARWQQLGIECRELDANEVQNFEPAAAAHAEEFKAAYHLPDEAQIRNPRHLRALESVCESTGVELRPNTEVHEFETSGGRITRVQSDAGPIEADQLCLATGCWSGLLATELGIDLPVRPIRGQIALIEGEPNTLKHILCVGPRYLVPRRDGLILIGSTQENAGFDKSTTDDGIEGLREFAESIVPATVDLPLKASWAGLRPGTPNRQPILGRLPQFDNAWLATGHFRAGLQLSPATAVFMRAIMLGQDTPLDVEAFNLSNQLEASELDPLV